MEFRLQGGGGRDQPGILQGVESDQAAMDLAPISDPQVIWRVSDLGPDIEKIRALLLPARERVGPEPERLTRGPSRPDGAGERRHVPPGIPAQVLAEVLLLPGVAAIPPGQLSEPWLLVVPDIGGRPALRLFDQAAMIEVARTKQAFS